MDVSVKIVEGDKERIQIFTGVVIAKNGGGFKETFTVRRIVQGEGVERVFPIHSPKIADIKVIKSGRVRRAKLYYMRDRTGKGTRLQEKFVKEKESPKRLMLLLLRRAKRLLLSTVLGIFTRRVEELPGKGGKNAIGAEGERVAVRFLKKGIQNITAKLPK